MAQKPIAMEQLKQVLQLQSDGISIREIARRVGISRNSVRKYLLRFKTSEKASDKELADSFHFGLKWQKFLLSLQLDRR